MAKARLLPANKNAVLPDTYDRYSYYGDFYLYQIGAGCEVWKVTKKKTEMMGIGWKTSGNRWGLFCTRVKPVRLVCVADTFEKAIRGFDDVYG